MIIIEVFTGSKVVSYVAEIANKLNFFYNLCIYNTFQLKNGAFKNAAIIFWILINMKQQSPKMQNLIKQGATFKSMVTLMTEL